MASTNAILATVYLLVTYSLSLCVCVWVCVCEAVYVITIFLTKTDEHEGCKNFMAGNAAETTGDRTWPQNPKDTEKTTLTKLQCILMTTVVTQTQQMCTKPLSLRSACLYQTDGSDFAIGPHTLPIKLNMKTCSEC